MSGPIVHGGGLAAAAARYGGRIEDWLDLSTGLNPCPPPLPAIDPRAWHRLPDAEREQAAREAARGFYQTGPARLPLPVPGTQAAIQILPRLVAPEKRIAVLSPTYGEYARVFEANGFAVDRIAALDAVTPAHGLVVVVNPNNPDGRLLPADRLEAAARRLSRQDALLVVDEAFADADDSHSLGATPFDNVIVFRSFGKFFGFAGLRLGFVIAGEVLAGRFAEGLGPWAVSGPALSVAATLLAADPAPLRDVITARRAALQAVMEGAGLDVVGGTGLFALVHHPQAEALHGHLCAAHILTRKFDYAPHWLRLGLAPDVAGDQRLADALARFAP